MKSLRPTPASLLSSKQEVGSIASYPALRMEQNDQRFYFVTLPKDEIFPFCYVADRNEDPEKGFQRVLDIDRAKDIAKYLDESRGSIPTNIVLSAQPEAEVQYDSRKKTLKFKRLAKSFLVLDGQHRLYGYGLTKKDHRVPVAIYDGLTKQHYLASIPEGMARMLATLIGTEAKMIVTPGVVRETVIPDFTAPLEIKEAWETHEVESIAGSALTPTEKESLVRARRGQGRYRQDLLRIEHECRVSHVRNPEYLIASHIKPWRHSDNQERLDGENGLLLNPSVDLLFDRGLISFEDNGDLLLSPVADRLDLPKMGIDLSRPVNVGGFTSGQKFYLNFHRRDLLLKTG